MASDWRREDERHAEETDRCDSRRAVTHARIITRGRAVRPLVHAAAALALFLLGVALRVINLGAAPFCCDELYDVFAAKSVLAGEGLQVPGREYTRAWLATCLTAGAFALFGESEATARLPAAAFGAVTLGLTYAAGRLLFGPAAALVALGLQALSPNAIDVDRFARLYSPLTATYLAASLATFVALEGRWPEGPRLARARLPWLAAAAAAGLVAVHLHPIALALGLVVQLHAAAMAAGSWLRGRAGEGRRYAALVLVLVVIEGVAAALPAVREVVVEAALTPLPWYRPRPGDVFAYHRHLADAYVWLWYLLWPATIVAVLARPRAGLFTASAFWLPFVLVSAVVVTKSPRYFVHLLPFAWLLAGGAAGALWPAARAALVRRLDPRLPAFVPRALAVAGLVALIALPLLRLTPSVAAALGRPWTASGPVTIGEFKDWRGLARAIGPRLEPDARLVASTWLAPRYYLGHPTYHLISGWRRRGEGDWERPEREGDVQVQRAADLAALRAGGVPVWVLLEPWRWAQPDKLDASLRRMLTDECEAVPVPRAIGFVVFTCRDRARGPHAARPAAAARGRPAPDVPERPAAARTPGE